MFCPCQLTVLKSSCSSPAMRNKSVDAIAVGFFSWLRLRLTGTLHAIDQHAPEAHLADHLVERATADPILLETVTETIAGCANEHVDVSQHAVLCGVVLVGEEVAGDELRKPRMVSDECGEGVDFLGRESVAEYSGHPSFCELMCRDSQDQDQRCR
jgi:hypothetical protein